jgi:hypothetical protein
MALLVKFLESSKIGFWIANLGLLHIPFVFNWVNTGFCLVVVVGLFTFLDDCATNTAPHFVAECN